MKRSTLLIGLLACLLLLPSAVSASGDVVVVNGTSTYVCDEEVHLDLLKVTLLASDPPVQNAVVIDEGCSGSTFERVEIEVFGDSTGIRFSNPSSGSASDVTIHGGYVALRDAGLNTSQYGVWVMGGSDITFENLHIWGIDDEFTQGLRISKAGSGSTAPTNVICDGCFLGGGANSNTVVIGTSEESGILNSYACPDDTSSGGAITVMETAVDPVNPGASEPGENFQPDAEDPHCTATDVRNAGLELVSGSTFPAEWTTTTSGTQSAAWTSDSDSRSGAAASRVDVSSWSSGRSSLVNGSGYEVPVTGDATYSASAWFKGTTSSTVPFFSWLSSWYVPGTGWVSSSQTHSTVSSSTYRQGTLALTSPTDATLLRLEPSFQGGTGVGLIDDIDVTLTQIAEQDADVCLVSNRDEWPVGGATCVAGETITVTNEGWECDQPLDEYGDLPIRVISQSTVAWDGTAVTFDSGCEGDGNPDTVDVIVDVQADGPNSGIGPRNDSAKFRQSPGPHDIEVTGTFDCGSLVQTTLAGSHSLPQSTITVASTADFPSSGNIRIDKKTITYTNKTATTFTGASGGTGTYPTGQRVTLIQSHPDTWQIQGSGSDLTIVNGKSGDYEAGTATCGGAGGSIFWSDDVDVTVLGGEYVGCNHGLNGGGNHPGAGSTVNGAKFRTGRTDGSDPSCDAFFSSSPCINVMGMTLVDVTCEMWNETTDAWAAVPPTN